MKIAIVRLSSLGDIVYSMVVLQFITKHLQNVEVVWFVENRFKDVLHFNPHIKEIVGLELKALKRSKSPSNLFKQINILKNAGTFDLIIDMQGLIKSSIVSLFLGKNRCGLDRFSAKEPLASFFYKKKILVSCKNNVVDRNLNLVAKCLNFKYSQKDILDKKPYLFFDSNKDYFYIDNLLSKHKKNIVLVSGSSDINKNYPIEKYANIIKNIDANFIAIWGNEQEKNNVSQLASCNNVTIAPKLSLNDLKYLISKSDLVFGGDTGPTHMAWAMNKPSLVLFGYTPKSRMFETNVNIAIESDSIVDDCKLNKKDDSIKNIEVSIVLENLKKLMKKI